MRGGGVEDLEENKPGKVIEREEATGTTALRGQEEAPRPEGGKKPRITKEGGIKTYKERMRIKEILTALIPPVITFVINL